MISTRLRPEQLSGHSVAKQVKTRPVRSIATIAREIGPPLPLQLLRARDSVMQLFRPHLRQLRLTDQQGRIIRVLAEHKSMEMGELAEHTCIHPASLSRMVPRMHARGIVHRSKDRTDGRRVMVAITKRGLALFQVTAARSIDVYATVSREIGATRLRDLHRCLDVLIAKFGGGAASSPRARKKPLARASARARS
jgi:homoprotocatechuate degradation regulator HpaR